VVFTERRYVRPGFSQGGNAKEFDEIRDSVSYATTHKKAALR
jgi:hypothetical protein